MSVLPLVATSQNPAQCMDLEPANPMMLHLVPRLGKDLPPIVLPLTPGFTIHSVCAFERAADAEGRRLLELYSTAWESQSVAEGKVRGGLLGSWEGAGNSTHRTANNHYYFVVTNVSLPNISIRAHSCTTARCPLALHCWYVRTDPVTLLWH